MKEKTGEAFTSNPLYHNALQPKVKGEGKKRKNVECARVRIRARVAKCTRRWAGALAYRYTPQVPKNSRELSEESRRFFLICPHGFHTVEGAKVASARGEGNKERTKIDSAACPLLQKRHLLDHRAHFSPVNKHYPVRAGEKSAARRKQSISRSLPFPDLPHLKRRRASPHHICAAAHKKQRVRIRTCVRYGLFSFDQLLLLSLCSFEQESQQKSVQELSLGKCAGVAAG